MKINYFLNSLGIGGTEKTAALFAKHSQFDITVFTYAGADVTRMKEFAKVKFVDRERLDWKELSDCDIVHAFRSGYPEHPEPLVEFNPKHFVETNIFGFIDPNPRIARSLFMSEWLMDYALARIKPISRGYASPPRRYDFVNNPVESPYSSDTIPGLDGDIMWLGRCGRPDNGIYNAVNVEAARLLRMQGYNVGFLVMAPPPNMIVDLKRYNIPFLALEPTIDPVLLSQFYNSVDIFAHSRADGETFGVNIAEAMIHKKPVVTHVAVPSNPQMGVFQAQTKLVRSGLTGFVAANDPVDYMDAVKRLLDNPELAEQMGMAGYDKIMSEAHVSVCVEKLDKIYTEVANE